MDVSEDMDISLSQSGRSNISTAQQNENRPGYLDYSPQNRNYDRRRNVKIRNPHYSTPGVPRNHESFAHHHYTGNNMHQPSMHLEPRVGNENTPPISATPLRGPWRYMEVNFPQNNPIQNIYNSIPEYTSEDTLSDEFDESDVDIRTPARSNIRRLQQGQRGPLPTQSYNNAEDRETTNPSSLYQRSTAAAPYYRYSPRNLPQAIITRQILTPSCSPKRSPNVISPPRPIIRSPLNLGISAFNKVSPQKGAQYLDNSLIHSAPRNAVFTIEPPNTDEGENNPRNTAEQNIGNTIKDFPSSPSRVLSNSRVTQPYSPRQILLATVHQSPRSESGPMNESAIEEYNYRVLNNLENANVSPRTSPRRNSTPFLHRARTLFQKKNIINDALEIPENNYSPIPIQKYATKPKQVFQSSSKSTQQSITVKESNSHIRLPNSPSKTAHGKEDPRKNITSQHLSQDIEDNGETSDNINLIVSTKNTCHENIDIPFVTKEPNSAHLKKGPFESAAYPTSHANFPSTSKKKIIPDKNKKREINLLLESNSFYGISTEETYWNENKPMTRTKTRAASRKNICNGNIVDGRDNYLKLNASGNMMERDEQICANAFSRKKQNTPDILENNTPDTVFKVPFPPTVLKKAERKEAGMHSNKEIDKLPSAPALDQEGSTNGLTEKLYLKNWTPKLKGRKVLIEGDLLNFGYVYYLKTFKIVGEIKI